MTFSSPCRRVISSSVSAIRAKSPRCTISSLVKVGMSLTFTRLCDECPPISPCPAAPPRSRPTTPPKSQFPRQPHTACRPAAPHANRNSPPHQHPSSVSVPNPPPTGTKGRQTLFHRANPSRHWRILPANKPSTVPKPPATVPKPPATVPKPPLTGTIRAQTSLSSSRFVHPLEESSR